MLDLPEIEEQFSILAASSVTAELKEAKRRLECLAFDSDEKDDGWSVIEKNLRVFDTRQSPKNQAALVTGLGYFFLSCVEKHFLEIKDFVLRAIQHKNGSVREAARKAADWLFISSTSKDSQVYKQRYLAYVREIESLIEKYDDRGDETEYIDEMKPSVEKSLQLLLADATRGYMYRKYLTETLESSVPDTIRAERFKVELAVADLLVRSKSYFKLDDVQQVVFDEDGADDLQNLIVMFDTGEGGVDIDEILEVVNDAWNYFPHYELKGKCPAEMIAQKGLLSPLQSDDLHGNF